MNLPELVREYERRRLDADRHGSSAPLARLYAIVLEELRSVDGVASVDRLMDTSEAASVLGIARKTAAGWAAAGRFRGAQKTSQHGEWRIPAREVYAQAAGTEPNAAKGGPRLWRAGA